MKNVNRLFALGQCLVGTAQDGKAMFNDILGMKQTFAYKVVLVRNAGDTPIKAHDRLTWKRRGKTVVVSDGTSKSRVCGHADGFLAGPVRPGDIFWMIPWKRKR